MLRPFPPCPNVCWSGNLPEEGVVLDSGLPQPLGKAVVGQFEAYCALELFKLAWSDLDVEVVTFVGDLEYLRPGEAVDA